MAAAEVLEHNTANAGARPADRTDYEKRIVRQLREGTGGWIDGQDEVSGYPELEVNTRSLNAPNGGTRAWIRQHARRVETPSGRSSRVGTAKTTTRTRSSHRP